MPNGHKAAPCSMVGVPTGTMPRTSCVYNTGRGSLPLESIVLYSGAEREGRPQHQREGGQGHGTRRVHAADGKGRLNFLMLTEFVVSASGHP
jgi:hypothetical protein